MSKIDMETELNCIASIVCSESATHELYVPAVRSLRRILTPEKAVKAARLVLSIDTGTTDEIKELLSSKDVLVLCVLGSFLVNTILSDNQEQ